MITVEINDKKTDYFINEVKLTREKGNRIIIEYIVLLELLQDNKIKSKEIIESTNAQRIMDIYDDYTTMAKKEAGRNENTEKFEI